jgi:RNA polymerase sigma-70 factor (ECF subfamily)
MCPEAARPHRVKKVVRRVVGVVRQTLDSMQRNDIRQIQQFYETSQQDLLVYALALTNEREMAEDIVHAVFERLLQRHQIPEELRPYVFRAIRNAALDERRRRLVRACFVLPLEDLPAGPDLDLQVQIQQALSTLELEDREILVLKIFSGLSFREIAEIREAPLSTISASYYRSLKKLRPLLMESTRA